jgi:hypothetical protein
MEQPSVVAPPVIPATWEYRQEDPEFQTNLSKVSKIVPQKQKRVGGVAQIQCPGFNPQNCKTNKSNGMEQLTLLD